MTEKLARHNSSIVPIVLTAETLRADFIDLWTEGKLAIKSVMMVTHKIEEAVFHRIIVLAGLIGAGMRRFSPTIKSITFSLTR
jgi:ABC-type taurine transport system ATPase subunit